MDHLPDTLAWAKKQDLTSLLGLVRGLVPHPLIVVASGGSFAAADFVVRLHQSLARLPAVALTPYEFVLRPADDVSGVLLLSAEGINPDIVYAARHASESSYPVLRAIVGRTRSPLAAQMRDCRHSQSVELDLPVAADPLGANSLLATVTLLHRAYANVFAESEIDLEIPSLSTKIKGPKAETPLFTVLAAGWSSPAAHYFETKCNETLVGTAVLTDYRNFAHGLHTSLGRRSGETAVIAFVSPDCRGVAAQTLELLPKQTQKVVIETKNPGSSGAIELVVLASQLIERISAQDKSERARPRIATLERNLYQMDISTHHRESKRREARRRDRINHWIQRKVGGAAWGSASDHERNSWRSEYEKWAALQRGTNVGGIVFDYDGTICEADEFNSHPGPAIAAALTRILDQGLALGVATGRGSSVVKALRAVLPEKYWPDVIVGPYNGSLVLSLADPYPEQLRSVPLMSEVGGIFKESPLISTVAKISFAGPLQVTLLEVKPLPTGMLRRVAIEALASDPHVLDAVYVQSSGVTVDVISRAASKRRVVDHIAERVSPDSSSKRPEVFAIGDQGSVDGNDFALLAGSHTLSVHKVSSRFDQCWNLARPGTRGTVAFIDYLNAIVPRDAGSNTFAFDIDALEST